MYWHNVSPFFVFMQVQLALSANNSALLFIYLKHGFYFGCDAESSQSSNGVVSPGDAFSDYIQKMKAFVSEMVTNLSSIMQDLVATSDEGQSKGRLKTLIINTKKDFTSGPSNFVLLAIASILVVLLKSA